MENRIVRLGLGCQKGFVALFLGALLLTGCRSSRDSGYADIPELPGTPVGVPTTSTPASAPKSSETPPPAVVASSPAVSSSSVVAAQPAPVNSGDAFPASSKVAQKHAPAEAQSKSGELIRAGEMLHIVFSDMPTPPPPIDQKVREDGTITLMFNESFHAADQSPGDLQQEIRKRYVPDYYAQLTATVTRDVLQSYYVDGEVRNPSKQPYTGPIKVTQAIASAGGFTDFANKRKVRLIRQNGKIEIIDCKKLIDHPELDPEVFPGDKVHVPRSLF